MKRLITLFLVVALTMFFYSCSESNTTAPELSQSDQVTTTLAKKPASSLNCTITYDFVGHLGIFDAEGRLWLWDGKIDGDIEGEILWWLVVLGPTVPNVPETAPPGFYEARWEIFVDDVLILAGKSGGKTLTLPDPEKDGIWRGNGIVTEAYEEYENWIGRNISEGGSVVWTSFPFSGEGKFRIN